MVLLLTFLVRTCWWVEVFSDNTNLEKAIHVPLPDSAIIGTCEKQERFKNHTRHRVSVSHHLVHLLMKKSCPYTINLDFDVISSNQDVSLLAITCYVYV